MTLHQWRHWLLYQLGVPPWQRTIFMVTSKLFTYPALVSLFNILHTSETPIMQTFQDLNSDPTSYIHTTHTIEYFFVKTADASCVS